MLTQLCIRNYAIAESLDIDLENGMTALTGETGAGKSIMLDALGLALGDRADAGIVRNRLKIEATRSDQPYRTMLDGPVQLANGVLQWEGQFKASARQDTERFSVKPLPVRVDGKFLLTPNQVQVPEYRLEVGASEDPYVVSGEGRANIRDKIFFTATADGRQVNLDRLGQEGEGAAPASLDRRLVALRSVIERIPVPGIDGEIDIKLPALIAGDTFIREVAARVRPLGGGWEVQSLSAKLI